MSQRGDDEGGSDPLVRIDRDLSRVRDELAEVHAAIAHVQTTIDELGRPSGDVEAETHQAAMWQARLGGLEARLSTLESSIRSEAERVRAAAGVVDLVADEFRTTLGATRRLDTLAHEISHQVEALAGMVADDEGRPLLERADLDRLHEQLSTRLTEADRAAGAGMEELRAAVDTAVRAVEQTVTQRHGDIAGRVNELTGHIDQLLSRTAALPAASEVDYSMATAVAPIAEQIGALSTALDALRTDLVAIRDQPDVIVALQPITHRLSALDQGLGDLNTTVDAVRAALPDGTETAATIEPLVARLGAIESTVTALRDATPELAATLAPIEERIVALDQSLTALHDRQPDMRAALEPIVVRVASVETAMQAWRDETPDVPAALAAIQDALTTMESSVAHVTQRLAAQPTIDALATAITAAVQPINTLTGDLRQDAVEREQALTAQLASIERQLHEAATKPAAGDGLLDSLTAGLGALLRENADDNLLRTQRLVDNAVATLSGAVTDVKASWPDVTAALSPLYDRLAAVEPGPRLDAVAGHVDALRGQIDVLAAAQPDVDAVLTTIADAQAATQARLESLTATVQGLHESRPDITSSLQTIATLLDSLRTDGGESRSELQRLRDHIATQVAPLAEEMRAAVGPLSERLDLLAADGTRVDERMVEFTGAVAALREELADRRDSSAIVARLDGFTEQLGQLGELGRADADRVIAAVNDRVDDESAVQAVARQVEQLAAALAAQPTSDPAVDRLSAELDQLGRALEAGLAAQLDQAATRIGTSLDAGVSALLERPTGEPELPLMVQGMAERLDRLAAAVAAGPEPDPTLHRLADEVAGQTAAVQHALDDTRAVLESLAARPATDPAIERMAGDLGGRLDALVARVAAAAEAEPDPALEELSAGLEHVRALVKTVVDRPAADPNLAVLTDEVAQLRTFVGGLADRPMSDPAVAELRDELGQRLDALAASIAERTAADPALEGLSAQLDRVRDIVTTLAEQPLPEAIAELGAKLDEVREQVGARDAPDPALGELRGDLVERIERLAAAWAERPISDPALGEVTAGLEQLRGVVTFLADRPTSDPSTSRLVAGLDQLREQVALLTDHTASAPAAPALESLAAQLAAVHALIGDLVERPVTDPTLREIGDGLTARLEGLITAIGQRPPSAPAIAELAADLDALRGAVDGLVERPGDGAALDAFGRDLTGRIDALAAAIAQRPPSEPVLRQLAQTVDANAVEVQQRLSDLVDRSAARQSEQTEAAVRLERLHEGLRRAIADIAVVSQQLGGGLEELRTAITEAATPSPADREALDTVLARLDGELGGVVRGFTERAEQLTVDLERVAAESANAASERTAAAVVSEVERVRLLVETLATDSVTLRGALANTVTAVREDIARIEPPPPGVLRSDIEETVTAATSTVTDRLDELAGAVNDVGATAAASRQELEGQLAALAAAIADQANTGEPGLARADLDDAVAASASSVVDTLATRLDDVQRELARLDQQAAIAELAAGIASLREQLAELAGARSGLDDLQPVLIGAIDTLAARLDTLVSDNDRITQVTASTVDGFTSALERVAGRIDADTNRVLDTVAQGDKDLRDDLRGVDGGLVELRRDLEQLAHVVDAVEAMRTMIVEPSAPMGDVTATALGELAREVVATREELAAVGRNVGSMRADLKHAEEQMEAGGATAELIAGAVAAMARLEGRMDHEFDAVGTQIEALGALVHHAIEAFEALEVRFAGEPAPFTEQLRSAAAATLEELRTSGRRRRSPRPLKAGDG